MGTLSPDEKSVRLQGYVRVTNNSGEDYAHAQTRLIVGKVHLLDQIAVVLQSGVEKITMVALDATTRALVSLEDAKRLRALGTPAGEAAALFVERRVRGYLNFDPDGRPAAPVHDALAVASIVNPAVISTVHAFVDVETDSELTVGRTVVDWRARSTEVPNAHVALSADEPLFVRMLLETMGRTS